MSAAADRTKTVTQSMEDYLEAVYVLISGNKKALVRDVAAMLSVRMPSVVKAIHELKDKGLVLQEPYGPIELTPEGQAIARKVLDRHKLLRTFLTKLGVPRRIADADACRMEHILSTVTLDKIRSYIEEKK